MSVKKILLACSVLSILTACGGGGGGSSGVTPASQLPNPTPSSATASSTPASSLSAVAQSSMSENTASSVNPTLSSSATQNSSVATVSSQAATSSGAASSELFIGQSSAPVASAAASSTPIAASSRAGASSQPTSAMASSLARSSTANSQSVSSKANSVAPSSVATSKAVSSVTSSRAVSSAVASQAASSIASSRALSSVATSQAVSSIASSRAVSSIASSRAVSSVASSRAVSSVVSSITSSSIASSRMVVSSRANPSSAAGMLPNVYAENCAGCHGTVGQGGAFRALVNYAGTLANMTAAIRNGPGAMPAYDAAKVTDADITAIFNFLKKPVVQKPDNFALADIKLLSPEQTLRKAAMMLVRRLPTAAETQLITAQGEAGLDGALDLMMQGDTFVQTVSSYYYDELKIVGIPAVVFYSRGFALDNTVLSGDSRKAVEEALNLAGKEIIPYVIANDRPISELLTANYFMVNGASAKAFSIYDDLGYTTATEKEWKPYINPKHNFLGSGFGPPGSFDATGLLTDVAWINTFPYTNTNLNRVRARMAYKQFLDFDVMTLSDRSPSNDDIANPTLNNPDCTGCHSIVDPVASLFLERKLYATYFPDTPLTSPTLWAAGFEQKKFVDNGSNPLRYLANQLINDPRYLPAQGHIIYRGLIGKDVLRSGTGFPSKAFAAQENFFKGVADDLKQNGMNIKVAVKAIVKSPYFRAEAISGMDRWEAHSNTGTVRLLSPSIMQAKTKVLLGAAWTDNNNPDIGTDQWVSYAELYGAPVTEESGDTPSASAANVAIQEKFAADMACRVVPREFFNVTKNTRKLLKQVDSTTAPFNADGSPNAADKQKILANIQLLIAQLFGETVAMNDPQVTELYDLWLATWQDGKANIGTQTTDLPCTVIQEPVTRAVLPVAQRLTKDPDYIMRSWMMVLSYMLSDYRFFYE